MVGCPSVDRLGWMVQRGGSLAPAVRWWLQLGSPQAVSPDIQDDACIVITWEIGWGCGLELQVSHSLETRFIVVSVSPKESLTGGSRWKLTPDWVSGEQKHPSLCILMVRAVSGQFRLRETGLASPSRERP